MDNALANSLILLTADDLVIFGGGHAATIIARAAKKGLVKPRAIAAVAPTWAGPLPIVFGRDSNMETRCFWAFLFPFVISFQIGVVI